MFIRWMAVSVFVGGPLALLLVGLLYLAGLRGETLNTLSALVGLPCGAFTPFLFMDWIEG